MRPLFPYSASLQNRKIPPAPAEAEVAEAARGRRGRVQGLAPAAHAGVEAEGRRRYFCGSRYTQASEVLPEGPDGAAVHGRRAVRTLHRQPEHPEFRNSDFGC